MREKELVTDYLLSEKGELSETEKTLLVFQQGGPLVLAEASPKVA